MMCRYSKLFKVVNQRWPLQGNVARKLSTLCNHGKIQNEYDAVIVGAGHNGLVAASYLQKAGLDVCVLERRHLVGGAAVTEELVPGFKFSRASYLLSLLRPQIIEELELEKHGLRVYSRNPSSYTPLIEPYSNAKSLILSNNAEENRAQIGKFSQKDAEAYSCYEEHLERIVQAMEPLLDSCPININTWTKSSGIMSKWKNREPAKALLRSVGTLGADSPAFMELMTAPATKILNKWFESEPLKATLATDAVIGSFSSPNSIGSGYVLLHHVMGELEGIKGAWGYVEGGMGSVTQAMARCAVSHGAAIFVDMMVDEIMVNNYNKAVGVSLKDGSEIKAKVVLSNATPKVTYIDLLQKNLLPGDFYKEISNIDYSSASTKINVALSRIPDFLADPCTRPNRPGPQHIGTIHLNCEHVDTIHEGYLDAIDGKPSLRPLIEMTLPSAVDPTIAPEGAHVAQMFVQYTPYTLAGGQQWDETTKELYAQTVFDAVEKYAPGFKQSIVGTDILTPPDLERVFNLTGGNLFHGAIKLDQLYFGRPTMLFCDHRCPIQGLYLCGSGSHPGGGVMGSPGKLAAQTVLKDFNDLKQWKI